MEKDHRLGNIAVLYKAGRVQIFRDIFKSIPKTVVCVALGKKYVRFATMISNIEKLGLDDIFKMAALFELTEREMLELIMKQWEADREANNKSGNS